MLVIGADVMSSIIDYTDRATCVLFGDGAGAVVLGPADETDFGILDFEHQVDGSGGPALCMPAGGSRQPGVARDRRSAAALREAGRPDGLQVRRAQHRRNVRAAAAAQQPHRRHDIDLFVSHQANRRIIMSAAERLGLPEEKVVINIERFGNTTAATIPLALNDAVNDGRLKKGDRVLLASVGAGFTVGAVLVRWAY